MMKIWYTIVSDKVFLETLSEQEINFVVLDDITLTKLMIKRLNTRTCHKWAKTICQLMCSRMSQNKTDSLRISFLPKNFIIGDIVILNIDGEIKYGKVIDKQFNQRIRRFNYRIDIGAQSYVDGDKNIFDLSIHIKEIFILIQVLVYIIRVIIIILLPLLLNN